MPCYEAKLKTGSIFDHNFPEAKISVQKIEPSNSQSPHPTVDKELIETLFVKYKTCLTYLKTSFKEYKTVVGKWFDAFSEVEKNSFDKFLCTINLLCAIEKSIIDTHTSTRYFPY
jgi:hypothetical protein